MGVQAIDAECDEDQGMIAERSAGSADLSQKAGGQSDLGLVQDQQRIFVEDTPVVGGGGNPLKEDRFEWDGSFHLRSYPWVEGRLGGFVSGSN